MNLKERLETLHRRITEACETAHRDPASVRLLAVSKTRSVSDILALAQLGQRDFGENYVSEALPKIDALGTESLVWHFIGPIQSNKTKAIANAFDWVHSIDRLKIVDRLNEHRGPEAPPLNVLIQVNLDQETQKAGCGPNEIAPLARAIQQAPHLTLRGLMAIPAPRASRSEQQTVFDQLSQLFAALKADHPEVDMISAGMSDDLEAAIEAGSTCVRVGTALFGPRVSTAS